MSAPLHSTGAHGQANSLDNVYVDESHCLLPLEVRSDKDNRISCYCRDAIADARYVYFTYLLPGKDRNLNGILLVLEIHARRMCGENYDVVEAGELKAGNGMDPRLRASIHPMLKSSASSQTVKDSAL